MCCGAFIVGGCGKEFKKLVERGDGGLILHYDIVCTHPTLPHRLSLGNFHTPFNSHRKYPEKFSQYYRMSVTSFDELLGLTGEHSFN
jgi:hypothetical protein